MPRVSVILPNYNYARFLRERVRSLISQTFRDFELIYVDDASTDESNSVIEHFRSEPRLRTIFHTTNSGTVYARWNETVAQSSGEWIWFPNADDSAHPRFLERLIALADAHPSAGLVHAQPATIDANGRLVGVGWKGDPAIMEHMAADYFSAGHEEVVRLTHGSFLSSASSLIIRRDAFDSAKGFDVRLWGVADWDFYLRILHRTDIAYCAEPLSYYRVHGSNTTSQTKVQILSLANAYCVAAAVERMNGDTRYSAADRDLVLRRARARVFDLFADGPFDVPEDWRFAADAVYRVVPDSRLRPSRAH